MIKSMAFTVYPVADLDRATEFYRDVVGLGEARKLNERWVEFDVCGATFAIATGGESIGMPAGSGFSVGFETDDVDATLQKIRDRGLEAGEPFDAPNCRAAFAHDPDGNRFAVHKLK